jgi:ribosome maturation factor RimP
MTTTSIADRVAEIAARVAGSEGMELVEVEYRGGPNNRILRIYIDKPGGVTLADCENVSVQVGTILDVEDVVPEHYTLEVSSPGLDRKLLKLSDYERFAGKKARVKLRQPVNGRSNFTGRLVGVEEGQPVLEIEGGGRLRFALEQVAQTRLVMEW